MSWKIRLLSLTYFLSNIFLAEQKIIRIISILHSKPYSSSLNSSNLHHQKTQIAATECQVPGHLCAAAGEAEDQDFGFFHSRE